MRNSCMRRSLRTPFIFFDSKDRLCELVPTNQKAGVANPQCRTETAYRQYQTIRILPRQSTVVKFALSAQDLSYYNHELEWVCEPGEFEVMIGANSRDTQSVMLTVTE